MESKNLLNNDYLTLQLKNGSRSAFSLIFKYYYSGLVVFAEPIVGDLVTAEDIVQTVFTKLWIKREETEIKSLRSFLIQSVKNRSIDYLREQKTKNKFQERSFEQIHAGIEEDFLAESELSELIDQSLEKLPPRCREIFVLSRFKDQKIVDIADQLKLSKRTVETQISKALKILRTELKDYLPLILFLFL